MVHVIQAPNAGEKNRKAKVTCLTCKLKGCIGRCRWHAVETPRTRKVD